MYCAAPLACRGEVCVQLILALGATSTPPNGGAPVTILIREGVTHGDSLSVLLYGITLVPLAEKLRAADPGLISPFYADDAVFNCLARQSAQLLNLLMERSPDRGYFPDTSNSLFILDTPGQEEVTRREFAT